jgi:hypothetical protein
MALNGELMCTGLNCPILGGNLVTDCTTKFVTLKSYLGYIVVNNIWERYFVRMDTSAPFTFGFLKILKLRILMYFKIMTLNM